MHNALVGAVVGILEQRRPPGALQCGRIHRIAMVLGGDEASAGVNVDARLVVASISEAEIPRILRI